MLVASSFVLCHDMAGDRGSDQARPRALRSGLCGEKYIVSGSLFLISNQCIGVGTFSGIMLLCGAEWSCATFYPWPPQSAVVWTGRPE